MILANIITTAITPFAKIYGWLLAAFYSVIPNYGIAIILLTLVTMIVVFPLTRKGTRSMMQMQLLQPEMKAIQAKYKKVPGMAPEERREQMREQQEEMMALYRENGTSPTGGCLPMFLQFPFFIILYNTIRGMTRTTTVGKGSAAHLVANPEYINIHTRLYHNLLASNGRMEAFGLNLADSVRTHQPHFISVIPYLVVILFAVGLQYVSIWQITNRNPAAANANPQMQQMQKFMPLLFLIFYIAFPAGVGIYFIVSSLFRIGQQEYMYKKDPHIRESVAKLADMKLKNPPPPPGPKKSMKERWKDLAAEQDSLRPSGKTAAGAAKARKPATAGAKPAGSGQRPRPQGQRPAQLQKGTGSGANGKPAGARGGQPSGARPAPGKNGQRQRPAAPAAGRNGTGAPRPAAPDARPAKVGAKRVQPAGSSSTKAAAPTGRESNGTGAVDATDGPDQEPRRRGRPR